MRNKYISNKSQPYWAFNIWNLESAQAVLNGAISGQKSIIIQTSMKAFDALDKEGLRFLISKFNEKQKVQAYLHLDHCKHIAMIEEAINYGWDSVMLDASDQALDENIKRTKEASKLARKSNVLIESEIGKIQGVEDSISSDCEEIAQINVIKQYLEQVDIDMIAVAIGTAHGMYKGFPKLHYELIEQVSEITAIPMVIHGGTGLTDDTFKKLLSYQNVKKINISTNVKLAYRDAIKKSIDEKIFEEDNFDPLIVNHYIQSEIQNMVIHKLNL